MTNHEIIGILTTDDETLCLSCGEFTTGETLTRLAYPDGFTCVECGDVIADENYNGGNN